MPTYVIKTRQGTEVTVTASEIQYDVPARQILFYANETSLPVFIASNEDVLFVGEQDKFTEKRYE